MRVVCAGHVNWDVTLLVDSVPTPDREAALRARCQSCGGSAANVAVGLTGLAVPTGLVGSVGSDEAGRRARRALAEAGVDVEAIRTADGETARKYLVVADDGEVLVLGGGGANESVGPGDVDPDYVRRAEHLHLTGQRPDTAARLAAIADEAGMTVSFDPGRRVAERDDAPVLPHVDLVFGTEHEAAALDGAGSASAIVRKRGAGGAVAETRAGTHEHAGYAVETVNTAGAGDAFAAGFLASWLEDRDVERALATANACGALAATREGAQVRLEWDAVRELRSREPR